MQRTSAPNIGEAPLPQRARSFWKTRISAIQEEIEEILQAERAQLPPWFVVGFGSGIAAWFALDWRFEWQAFLCLSAALSLLGFGLGLDRTGRSVAWFALAALLGCALIWARSAWVAHPRLERPLVLSLAAEVVSVDHLAARGTVRLLLKPEEPGLPRQVRVSVDE